MGKYTENLKKNFVLGSDVSSADYSCISVCIQGSSPASWWFANTANAS